MTLRLSSNLFDSVVSLLERSEIHDVNGASVGCFVRAYAGKGSKSYGVIETKTNV